MKIAPSTLSIALLLAVASGTALASPGQRAWREELRAMQQPVPEQPVREARAEKGAPNPQNGNAEEPKKQGKMTAEERRALRRQINEAGRDIYAPAR
jgi:hypothetical protein